MRPGRVLDTLNRDDFSDVEKGNKGATYNMPEPRYDEEENVSRHSAADADDCLEMEQKYGWDLKRVEDLPETPNQVFEVDCVFEGETEFPKSYYETDSEEEENA